MASGGVENITSDEIISNNCCICAKKNIRKEAERYCLQCKDYYCTGCVDVHTLVPGLDGHTLLGKSDFKTPKERDVSTLPSHPTQRCEQHKTEVLNMYCEQHDEVCCATCVSLHHRNCSDVEPISENIDKLYKQEDTSSMKREVNEAIRRMKALKEDQKRQVKELKNVFDTNIKSIKSFKAELQAVIDSMERETTREITEAFKRIEACLTNNIQTVESLEDSLKELVSKLEKTEDNKAKRFVMLNSVKKMSRKVRDEERTLQNQQHKTFSFTASDNVKSNLSGYKTLGSVSTIRSIQKKSFYKVISKREINVKHTDDSKDCCITGSCVMDDGHLLLCNEANRCIKRFNTSTEKLVDYITMSGAPGGICSVSSVEAAVCLYKGTVQFVSLGKNMTLKRRLEFSHRCFGICVQNDSIFITDQSKLIYIYDLSGRLKRKVEFDATGKNILDSNRHISVTDNGKLFVADFRRGIVVLDTDGKYVSTINNKQVQGYQGVCTDGVNLFVCGWSSDNVGCLLLDTYRWTELGQVKTPFSVSFDRINKRLYCTGSTLTVFELE